MQNVLCLQQLFAVKCMWAAPDWDAGVMCHTAGHGGFCSFDDALILRRISDACTCWLIKQRKCTSVYAQVYDTNMQTHLNMDIIKYKDSLWSIHFKTHTHTLTPDHEVGRGLVYATGVAGHAGVGAGVWYVGGAYE